ncbi:AlpA family phage regulatory protein [Xanthobacter sp. V2C-8]|uniref:helix-turn-helix transcriptional regulator n=1 Tax=Xanthobacter albus TaxID=3119929 RepID=UPI003729B8DE
MPNHEKLLRLSEIIRPHGPIPVARSTWYAGVQAGRFPRPVKLGARAVAWRASDIANLVENGLSR